MTPSYQRPQPAATIATTPSHPSFASTTFGEIEKIAGDIPGIGGAVKAVKATTPVKTAEDLIPSPGGLIPGVGSAITSPIKTAEEAVKTTLSVGEFLASLSELKTWVRIGKVVLGGILVLIGLWMLLKSASPTAASVVSAPARYTRKAGRVAVTTAVPEAGAAKLGARVGAKVAGRR